MKIKILLYFAILLMLIGIHHSYAFDVKATNTSNMTLLYELIWIDCDWFPDDPKPCQMGMSELPPGKVFEQENRRPGRYVIRWRNLSHLGHLGKKDVMQIINVTENGILLTTPDGLKFLKGT